MRTSVFVAAALPAELARHSYWRDRLRAEVPNLDHKTLADTLEGLTDLREMLSEVIRSALDDEALVGGLGQRLADMKARLERLSSRAKRKRDLALHTMVESRITRIAEADFTASVRCGNVTLDVFAEELVPAEFWRPQPAKLDRQGLLAALKAGQAIEGTALLPPQSQLTVRAK
mgnify:FL=1